MTVCLNARLNANIVGRPMPRILFEKVQNVLEEDEVA